MASSARDLRASAIDVVRQQLERREYDLAVAAADKVIGSEPPSATAHLLRAEAHFGKRNLPRAIADATRAIDLDGTLFAAYAMRCELHLVAAKFAPAVDDCSKAIVIGPATSTTFASRGAAHVQLKNFASAQSDLDRSLDMKDSVYARYYRGLAHLHQKHRDRASDDFRKVLAENPHHQGAIIALRRVIGVSSAKPNSMEVWVARLADARCGQTCPEWIAAEGDIDGTTADKFRAVLKSIGDKKLPIFINSAGGRINVSLEIGRLIRARKLDVYVTRSEAVACKASAETCRTAKSRGVVFAVPHGKLSICASACANIFAAGSSRSIGISSLVGVHQAAYYTSTDGAPKRALDRKIPDALYARLKDYFVEMGVDTTIMVHMLATPHSDMYWFRRDELARTRLATQSKSGEELITGTENDEWMSAALKETPSANTASTEPRAATRR